MQSQIDRKKRDEEARTTINQLLDETGERERLKELLKSKLIECGWRDELKSYCKEVIREKGLQSMTVDDLISEITPRGRATIPTEIRVEMLERVRKFVTANQQPVSKVPETSQKTVSAAVEDARETKEKL